MKKIIFIIVLLFINITYSQSTMVIGRSDAGVQTIIPAGNIDQMTFYPACSGTPSVTYAGKVYATVYIGSQCWLAENLNVGKRIDGSSNQTSTDTDIEKYCYNDLDINCDIYGGLYQWDEAMQYSTTAGVQGICPTGWHIPTLAEFETLKFTASSSDGNKLKAVGQGTGSGAGTNTSGFSALLAGIRVNDGTFGSFSLYTAFWSSQVSSTSAYMMSLYHNTSLINLAITTQTGGMSVRCLKD